MKYKIGKTFKIFDEYFYYDFSNSCIEQISKNEYFTLKEIERNILYANQNEIDILVKDIEHPKTFLVESILDNNLKHIILQVTQSCNFRCKYCSFSGSGYLNRRHEKKHMSWEIAKKAIDYFIQHSKNSSLPSFGFYGGEPFLYFDVLKKAVDYINTIFGKNNTRFLLTTNLSILNDDIMKLIVDNNFSLLVSLDGPDYVQNRNRRFAINGEGSFEKVYQNIKKLYEYNKEYFVNNVKINAVTDMKDNYSSIKHFFDHDQILKNISYNIVVESNDLNEQVLFNTNNFNIYFQKELMGNLIENIKKIDSNSFEYLDGRLVYNLHKIELILNTRKRLPEKYHHSGPCIPGEKRLFVDVNGRFYPCEKISENDYLSIGNVDEGINYNKCIDFLNVGKYTDSQCKKCWAIEFCSICVTKCYNNDTLSVETKLNNCELAKAEVVSDFRKYTEFREILKMYTCWRGMNDEKNINS